MNTLSDKRKEKKKEEVKSPVAAPRTSRKPKKRPSPTNSYCDQDEADRQKVKDKADYIINKHMQVGKRIAPDRTKKDFFYGMTDLGGEDAIRSSSRRLDLDRVMDASFEVMN